MSLLLKSRRAKLSELEIDADKDWQGKGITGIKQVAALMSTGDLVAKGSDILVRIATGPDNYVLTSRGAGKLPTWAPPGGALKYYYPVLIESSHAEAIVALNQSYSKVTPLATAISRAWDDQPAENVRRLTPTIALANAEGMVSVDRSHSKNVPIGSEGGFWVTPAVGGAVLDDGGVLTNYTTQVNSGTANDVKLLPDAPLEVNDAFYFGLNRPWDQLWLNIGTAGEGNWMLTEEYWSGTAWAALTVLKDNTNQFMTAGKNNVRWARPGDWALTTILGMELYWMRFRVANVNDYTTQPLGTQGWCEVLV